MIIKIKVYKLMNMLKIVSKIIKNRKIESILSYILIKIIKNKIFCIAINEEIEIVTYDVYENYIKDMEVVIKCDLIYEICKRCEDSSYIFIKKNRNSIEIKLDDIYFMLPNTFSDKFPCFENEKNNKTKFKIKSHSLHKLFSYLLISLSENNMQEFLNGIYLELNENLITAFTSDGERFTFTYDFIEEHNKNFNIIIPKQAIKEIINLTETTKNIYITLTKKYIKFVTDNTTITSKLINDIYTLPNLKIKQDLITKISLDKNEIKKMLYKINFFIKDKKITFEFEKNTINICTQINNEKAIIYSKINNLFKENLTVSFNNKYFSDILKYISHNTFQFIISKEKKFIIIKEDNCKYMYTLIPF